MPITGSANCKSPQDLMGEQGLLNQPLKRRWNTILVTPSLKNVYVFQHADEIEIRTETLFLKVDFESVNRSLAINLSFGAVKAKKQAFGYT